MQLVECPRDAWQGYTHLIPTATKVRYLTALLRIGFHTLDAGSFVSPKAVPQMADTAEVLDQLPWSSYPQTGLLVIIANERGLQQALAHSAVRYVGYPLSLSETFQQNNARQSIAEAKRFAASMAALARQHHKEPVVYLSMGFGNPYGEPYAPEMVVEMGRYLWQVGVSILSIADTVGVASPELIHRVTSLATSELPQITWGVHLHATPQENWAKLEAAWQAGIRRFDSALGGFGGCPFAGVPLVSNIRTETLLQFILEKTDTLPIDQAALEAAIALLSEAFPA